MFKYSTIKYQCRNNVATRETLNANCKANTDIAGQPDMD